MEGSTSLERSSGSSWSKEPGPTAGTSWASGSACWERSSSCWGRGSKPQREPVLPPSRGGGLPLALLDRGGGPLEDGLVGVVRQGPAPHQGLVGRLLAVRTAAEEMGDDELDLSPLQPPLDERGKLLRRRMLFHGGPP